MDFPVFLNKWIIGFKPIKYTPFWWWYRLMCHKGFRFDDYGIWGEFWHILNHGWQHMESKKVIICEPDSYQRRIICIEQ